MRRKNITPEQKVSVRRLLGYGLTPKQVAKEVRLSASTVYKIQRDEKRRGVQPDPELGPHRRELFYFGQRLRECVTLPLPHEVVTAKLFEGSLMASMWHGSYVDPESEPRDEEERSVEKDWGYGERYDARQHPLWPHFEQHLKGEVSLEALRQRMEEAFQGYAEACKCAYDRIEQKVGARLSHPGKPEVEATVQSLLYVASSRASGSVAIHLPYSREKSGDGERWQLRIGAWVAGWEKTPEELDPLEAAHKDLAESLPSDPALRELSRAENQAREAMQLFREAIGPDSRLRKLVLNGHCDWCP
ncbi:MAG: hypothetical protein ACOC58_03445 [Chloroflexota bacterium]